MSKTVGFVGLGVMGGPMAHHLSKKYSVVVYDADTKRLEEFPSESRAASVEAVGKSCDVVLMSLPSTDIVEAVVLGEHGLINSLKKDSAVIDLSTTNPSATRRIAAELAKQGIAFLDAPVSGGDKGAKNATLAIMVGGEQAVFDGYKEILEVVGASVVRVGPVGTGEVAKLINNMIVASTFSTIAEGVALGAKNDLDPQKLYEAIKDGWAGSPLLEVSISAMLTREYNPPNGIDILYKDLGYALELAQEQSVPVPLTAEANEVFKAARSTGRGKLGQPAIIGLWEDTLGIRIGGTKE